MKTNIILNNLKTIICAIVILNTKLTLSFTYYSPYKSQHLHIDHTNQEYYQHLHYNNHYLEHHDYLDMEQSQSHPLYHRQLINSKLHDHHDHHDLDRRDSHRHQHFSDRHLMELTESAKDPKNLRNGIYHDGAITYDLGLPNYEILNPHDPPEIITSDHPHYEEQLNHIKKTNNYTIEDFGVTDRPENNSISETTTISNTSTETDIDSYATTETTDITTSKRLSFITRSTKTTVSPIKKYKNMKSDIEKHLRNTKEKLKILSDDLDLKNKNHKISKTSMISRKTNRLNNRKQRPHTTNSPPKLKHHSVHEIQEITAKELPGKSVEVHKLPDINEDLETISSFYGQSVLLPAEYFRPPKYSYRFGNPLISRPYSDNHEIAYATPASNSHLPFSSHYNILPPKAYEYLDRLHRSTSLASSNEYK